MLSRIGFFLRSVAKMVIQNLILPFAYAMATKRHPGEKKLYVFADAHHTKLPFSLAQMYHYVCSQGITPVCHFYDYTHEGSLKSLCHAVSFMDILAQAKCVFICDTFLPVSSPKLDPETKVVQLCHFSGPFKKIGYATTDDVPGYYKGNVFRNYSLVTASSDAYVPLLKEAMRQPEGVVQPLGISRSDVFFNSEWVKECRKEFVQCFPEAAGKKVLLWAPTFRGKAAAPDVLSNQAVLDLQNKLGDTWLVLIKHHPHDDAVAADPRCRSNCDIPTERLLPVTDLLITDYSTIVLDYLAYDKPFILYAPDLAEYEHNRGFFVPYRSITKNLTTDAKELEYMIPKVYQQWCDGDREEIARCKQLFVSACDGKATARIWKYLHDLDKNIGEIKEN